VCVLNNLKNKILLKVLWRSLATTAHHEVADKIEPPDTEDI
jgi:hypothetical protein